MPKEAPSAERTAMEEMARSHCMRGQPRGLQAERSPKGVGILASVVGRQVTETVATGEVGTHVPSR